MALSQLLRRVEDEAAWRALAPDLGLGDEPCWAHPHEDSSSGSADGEAPGAADPARALRLGLSRDGYARVEGLIHPAEVRAVAGAIQAIREEGLHPLFVFVYDAPWKMLRRMVPLVSRALGGPVDPLVDFWAWHIDPQRDAGGWAPHRGWYSDVRDPGGLPSLVNVWVSLSSATPENACMHVVPLGEDAAWPGALERRPFDLSAGRPLPTEPGDVLMWNANVLHWGGKTHKGSAVPRISASFTLARRGWRDAGGPLPHTLRFSDRLDLIAEEIGIYGDLEAAPDPAPSGADERLRLLLEWARIRSTMRSLARKRDEP